MFKNSLSKVVSFTSLPVAIYSVQRFSANPLGSTTFWWLVKILVLLIFWIAIYYYFESENKRSIRIVKLFILWILFSIIRGIFVAETYWDWKGLIENAFALLIPIVVYTASNKERLQSILSFFVKYTLPFSLLILLPLHIGDWGWYLFPLSFLILFIPALKLHWKVILIVITLVVALGDLSVRSHIIKFGVPILLLSLYYFRFYIASEKIIEFTHKIFLIAPWVLFFIGISGIFNVFNIKEYIGISYVAKSINNEGFEQKQAITQDSRTFIYTESLQSAKKHNYWVLGRSPARGNDTDVFASIMEEITGRSERLSNEVGIVNLFNWTGIIGVLLYFLVFSKASFLAIHQSNNIYIKLIGLYVAFRWLYAWIEDNGAFNMNTITIWLMVGICFSKSFRKMNNVEAKLWARGIFDKSYIRLLHYIRKDLSKTIPKLN